MFWNGKLIKTITPKSYRVHGATFLVDKKQGINRLRFSGAGTSEGAGVSISMIQVL